MIPYGRQSVDEDDIKAVVEVLRSDWLTTGPEGERFENMVAECCGTKYAVAVSSGTAALHCAMFAAGIGPGDEVIVPPMTFAATSNAVLYQGGLPVFTDVDANTLLIDPVEVSSKITTRTKAIIAVDYAGQPCDYDALRSIADKHGLLLIADACHSLGGSYKERPVGSLADVSVFSFHPVKPITTGEGGMIATDDKGFADRMRRFRSHGITTDARQRAKEGRWFYEMVDLGFNYRITDIQCALGLSQLKKLSFFVRRRNEIARLYTAALEDISEVDPIKIKENICHGYHLYVIRVNPHKSRRTRDEVFSSLLDMGVGVNVHYIPIHLHPYYKKKYGYREGLCPIAERAFREIISLPIYPGLKNKDIIHIINCLKKSLIENN